MKKHYRGEQPEAETIVEIFLYKIMMIAVVWGISFGGKLQVEMGSKVARRSRYNFVYLVSLTIS